MALSALVAAFTYAVDPYGLRLRETLVTDGWMFYHVRMTRPHQLNHVQGTPLVLGSSRVARLRPGKENGTEGFSSAVPGATPYELLRFLQHADALGHAQQTILSLDFSAFFDTNPRHRFGFEEARLLGGPPQPSWQRLRRQLQDMHRLLLSGTSIASAINKSLGRQGKQMTLYRDGTWAMVQGPHNTTRKGKFFQIGRQYQEMARDAGNGLDLTAFRAIVAHGHQQGLDLVFFISPVHHFLLSAYESAGKLELYRDWHAQLVQVIAEEAAAASATPFPLYGFQTDWHAAGESITEDPADAAYLDGLHADFNYGDRLRERLLGKTTTPGQPLSQDNLAGYWQTVLDDLARYQHRDRKLLQQFRAKLDR